jgi:hypothetical protein
MPFLSEYNGGTVGGVAGGQAEGHLMRGEQVEGSSHNSVHYQDTMMGQLVELLGVRLKGTL